MKKVIPVLLFFFACTCMYGQTPAAKYAAFLKKADTFYRTKNYKASTAAYTQAFRFNHWKASATERYNAACAWALAGVEDSAYYQLHIIVTKDKYSRYEQISTEHDLKSIQRDKRWKPLLEQVKQNAKDKEAKLNKPLIKQLDSILGEDQQYRNRLQEVTASSGADSKEVRDLWKTINTTDSSNMIFISAILDRDGWLGADIIGQKGNSTLFLVIRHADLQTQEKYVPMMREAVKNGNAEASDLALLEDGVALGEGKKQIYGSQIVKDPKTGKDTLAPVEDFKNVEKRRQSVGLEPLEEYVKQWGIVYKVKPVVQLPNSDFTTAREIYDSIVGPVNVSKGFGRYPDFMDSREYKEENSAWFKFKILRDTVLTFDLVPVNPKDDYDFVLFKCPDPPACIDAIRAHKQQPERWCSSVNFDKNGSTGLSEYTDIPHLPLGEGFGYVAGLPVKAGETCYLMVNYPGIYHQTPKGFTLYFYNYWPKKPSEASIKRVAAQKVKTKPPPPVVLENVLFELDKTVLLRESSVALDKLVTQLQTNKTMKIEIRGHTDNTGDEAANQKLSEARAKAIVDYLVAKKIEANRLSYKGFGSTQPIAPNDTDEGKKKNRRVEFVILSR